MSQFEKPEERVTRREDIIRKVKACLARGAEGSGASDSEMETAMRQADKLMAKYNLEMKDVIETELSNPVNITWGYVRTNMFKKNKAIIKEIQDWPQWIAVECATMFDSFARIQWVDGEGFCVGFYGYQVDVEVCCWTFDYVLDQVRRRSLSPETESLWGRTGSHRSLSAFRSDFREGMAHIIAQRIKQIVEERRRAVVGTGSSLVVSKKAAIEAKYGSFAYKQGTCGGKNQDSTAFTHGMEEGKKVNISTAVRGPSNTADAITPPRKQIK